ncbi:MAG: ComEC/Rec2 family competence protein [Opitutaceae bacterium]|nr:ComEC/Rec2 family competence protein [Opitutaceae bacterium]
MGNTTPPPSRSIGHRAPLLWLIAPFMAGLMAAGPAELLAPALPLAVALASVVTAMVAYARAPRMWPMAIVVAMAAAGSAAYTLQRKRLPPWDTLPAREARLTLRIERVFSRSIPRQVSGLGRIVATDEHLRELSGQRLYFSLALRRDERAPIRSAEIAAVGVLVALPRNPPVDSFDGYLAAAGMNFRFTRGRMVAEAKPASAYHRFCATASQRFKGILGLGIAEKRPLLAGLLRAMMLGETHELSDEQRRLFMQSGTMHLFAISGLNIAVIAGAIQAALLLLRLPRWARFGIGVSVLWIFVDITGAAPSAVRAFIMAGFLQAAFVFRQPGNPFAALVASAFVVLLVAPLQLFSASFLMSYGIVTALLVLGLPLGDAWLERWKPWRDLPVPAWRWWHQAVAAAWRAAAIAVAIGVATTLVSLLTGVQFFGLLTPGALLANLVLIPAAMIVTLGGFVSIICGLVGFGAGAALCNHAAAMVLLVIEWLVGASLHLPWAFVPARYLWPWVGTVALAALMFTLIGGYAWGWRRERGSWWPPFIIVALTLIFGVKFG